MDGEMTVDRYPYLSTRRQRLALRAVMATAGRLVEVEQPEEVRGLPDPAIFALNHNNSFESVVVPSTLIHHRQGRLIHFMVDWMFLHIPVVGWVMRQNEPVPVYTKPARWRVAESYRLARRDRSPVDACLSLLTAGESVGVFPEGTRNPRPDRLLRGRAGVGRLVLMSDAPVVPVGIRFPVAERTGRIPPVGRMRIRVGRPLLFGNERAAVRDGLAAGGGERPQVLRSAGAEVVDRIMRALSDVCSKRYPYTAPAAPALPAPALEGSQP